MRKVVKKLFWAWDFDKEEKWLNEMAAQGLALVAVGFCRYEFEDCVPGAYEVRLELLEHALNHPSSQKYIDFLEETGIEHVGSWTRWAYFRKKKEEGTFELFSDNDSRVKHLSRIITMLVLLAGANLYIGAYNLFLYFSWELDINLMGLLNLVIGVLAFMGVYRLYKKRKKLKAEQQIFE